MHALLPHALLPDLPSPSLFLDLCFDRFLCLALLLVAEILRVDPGLDIVRFLEATLQRMRARPVTLAVQAVLSVCLLAAEIGTSFSHPRDHAAAAETITAVALREATLLCVEEHVALRT